MSAPTRRPRAPGIVYAATAVVLLLVLTALTLTSRQTPPPTIAEFAPQAVEHITDSPADQSSGVGGSATGECLTGPACAAVDAPSNPGSVLPIDVPRVRKCIGDPPRQIEDPQSPPCVPYWTGDNGGATYRGVTRDTIRIAGTLWGPSEQVLEAFFNKRFEFYGRKIDLLHTGDSPTNCTGQKAQAVQFDESLKVFGAIDTNNATTDCLYRELARRGLIGVNSQQLLTESPDMRQFHPHLWQYDMGIDEMFSATAAMICARLADGKAIHAGNPTMQMAKRKFGIILHYAHPDIPIPLQSLTSGLGQCGQRPAAIATYGQSAPPQDVENAVLQMQANGVTSVICLCVIITQATLSPAATSQGYFPEWITSSYGANDINFWAKASWTPGQREHLFGISSHNRQVKLGDEPFWWAARESDPAIGPSTNQLYSQYRAMLLLASGIQMAGPRLTPATFGTALHRTRFPNPNHPNIPAKVGFLSGDHGMTNDSTEYWWSETDRSPEALPNSDGSVGTLCYVDGGARRDTANWPSDPDPFFAGPCISGA